MDPRKRRRRSRSCPRPAKLDNLKKDLLDIVAQILPDLQAQYSDVWVDHLVAVGDVEEREAALTPLMDEEERLRAAQLEEVWKIPDERTLLVQLRTPYQSRLSRPPACAVSS